MTTRHRFSQQTPRAGEAGFTLLEGLITAVVFGIGLLGISWLQFFSLNFTESAHRQSQATILAADLAERMRANPVGAENGAYDKPSVASEPSDCTSAECTPAELARRDVWEWQQQVIARLGGDPANPTAAAVVCLDDKPDELSDSGTFDEERSENAFDAGCTLHNDFCNAGGAVYAIKIWWCGREVEGAEEGANAIRYLVHTLVP